ncbi:MAG: methyltransferase domain-containing protein [Alphaproteobacteria bacterium]|nr:methyltransferase domain-containing protein [Alphaproteobacteria bacterium]
MYESKAMPTGYSNDYLLDKKVKIFQPLNGYRASSDAVLLAAMVAKVAKNARILDVGSGTGAVSLCLAARLQAANPEIHGVELQPELAELANLSAAANGFDFVRFHHLDIRQKIDSESLKPCSFDAVISNPPYSENDMPSPNNSKATAHNHHDFSLEQWIAFCLKMAKPFGQIFLVHRAEALAQICATLNGKAGGISVLPIYSKKAQNAKRIIVAAQKDSKAPCRILPPFVTHDEKGQYTEAAEKILRQGLSFAEIIKI